MSGADRFKGLKKLPEETARVVLARNRVTLKTTLESRPAATVPEVLAELEEKGAVQDMLQLLAHALPAREAVWWSCLAARDICPADAEGALPACLTTAEAWVFRPGDETRMTARKAMEDARPGDKTKLCAMAVAFCDGKLGPGDLQRYDGPPGACGNAVFGVVVKSYVADKKRIPEQGQLLLARALDIARGGNGKVAAAAPTA